MGEKIKGFIKKHKLLLIIIAIIILSVGVILFYESIYLDQVSKINLTLKGEKEIMLPLNQEYQEQGATASFRKKNLTKEIQIHSNLDNTKIGEYTVDYQVKYKKKKKTITRKVIVVDLEGPIINIKGNENIQIEILQQRLLKRRPLRGGGRSARGYSKKGNNRTESAYLGDMPKYNR